MTVIDIIFRLDDICKKYEKYDIDKHRDNNTTGDDAFAQLYGTLESEIDKATMKSDAAFRELNRAVAVALNAEVRRIKARVNQDLPKLRKLAVKKVKGLPNEDQETRTELVFILAEKVESISDGHTTATTGGWETSISNKNIKFDTDENFSNEYFQESEESSQFRKEYEMRKLKQEQGLDIISEGLDTLKNLAQNMGEEIDRQIPLMDDIETKVDKASADLKSTNVRLKQTLFKMRSSRNFCIDFTLICIILGIVLYIYSLLQ